MRSIGQFIKNDLEKKMVFVGGPRQCGKTTLAKALLKEQGSGLYLNWDRESDKRQILKEAWNDDDRLLIFDEIHKYPKWKNWIKGLFDATNHLHQFLLTGSARLDVYRRGGDSLLGRYHYWRLHPFTLDEYPNQKLSLKEAFDRLMRVGGFPEPFLANDDREARRWREERHERIIRDDIRDLENVKNIQQMSVLLQLLQERVGGPIVIANLARDLQVSHATVLDWIEIFEKMYLIFTVRPHTKNLPRSLVKPFKVYFFDNADVVGDEGARFENLVATHLLKRCHLLQDYFGEKWELKYLRNKEKQEVDFLVLKDGKEFQIIEAKWNDSTLSKSLVYYGDKLKVASRVQLVGNPIKKSVKDGVHILNAIDFLSTPIEDQPRWFSLT